MDSLEIPNADNLPQENLEGAQSVHKCKVCVHQNRRSLEQRYAQGWRVMDLAKWYKVKYSDLIKHLEESGLKEKCAHARLIKVDEFCDEVIRAALPILNGESTTKGLYIRDALDAAKVKLRVKDERKIDELWEEVDRASKESVPDVNKTVNRLAKVMGKEGQIEADF
ncbi:MAG: hypothetical protein KKD69_06380 [Euryarchaeota archaeon]|nr:hypothetical protein [Euryarchaeota archaeon]